MDAHEYISLDALAASLGLPRTYLRRLVDEGTIPVLNVSGRLRFDEKAVREALRILAAEPARRLGVRPVQGGR